MCSYDDMIVTPTQQIKQSVTRTNSKMPHNIFSSFKKTFIIRQFESARLLLLIYLLISPVSGGPFILPGKTSRPTPVALALRHSHRGHPKVGIGIGSTTVGEEYPASQESLVHLPTGFKGLPSFSHYKNSLESLGGSVHHFSLQDSLSGLEDSPSALSATQVPKPSGAPLLRVFEAPQNPSVEGRSSDITSWRHQIRSRPRQSFHPSSMDEVDSAPAGRERRATASTPSGTGGGEWRKPCPNLDSVRDTSATTQSLSDPILKAIYEARSQVLNFIDDFARETLQAESWEKSFKDHQDYSLPFLNNSSGVDLSVPENVPFQVALQEAYELMQRRAVGIEQVTLDQAIYQANFLSQFRHVEDRIVHLLCLLRHAMIQWGVAPKQDVTKDVMEEKTRDMDVERRRNIRDAVILREYLAGLEDLHNLFNHYTSSPQ